MKKCLLILLIIGIGISQALSSDILGTKSSSLLSLTGYYSSKGGDLYEIGGSKQTIMGISPTINYFVAPNIFAGLSFDYLNTSIGDESYSSITVGPNVGYLLKDLSPKLSPYVSAGFRYADADDLSGTAILLGAGLIIPASQHAGLVIDLNYHMDDMKIGESDESFTGNRMTLGIGIVGILQLF